VSDRPSGRSDTRVKIISQTGIFKNSSGDISATGHPIDTLHVSLYGRVFEWIYFRLN